MAIDGNIWIAGEGKIYKFAQGAADNFTLEGLSRPLGKHVQVLVEQDGDKLYVLDTDNQRVVEIKKDGTYVAQYQDERLGQAVGGAVDEKNNKAYILLPGAVWEMKLE
jgi:DNA-binding beta-propeller fold protein YncE